MAKSHQNKERETAAKETDKTSHPTLPVHRGTVSRLPPPTQTYTATPLYIISCGFVFILTSTINTASLLRPLSVKNGTSKHIPFSDIDTTSTISFMLVIFIYIEYLYLSNTLLICLSSSAGRLVISVNFSSSLFIIERIISNIWQISSSYSEYFRMLSFIFLFLVLITTFLGGAIRCQTACFAN